MRVLRLAVVSVLLAAAAVGVRHAWNLSQDWVLRQRLQALAEQAERAATPAEGRAVVRRIRQLPGASIGVLVQLATSRQPGASAAAREAINARLIASALKRRQLGAAAVEDGEYAELAGALAEHADRFTGSSIPWAQRTVNRILAEAQSIDPPRLYEVLGDCERAASTLARLSTESVGEAAADATAALRPSGAPSRAPADRVEQSAGAARFVAAERPSPGGAALNSPSPSTLKIGASAEAPVVSSSTGDQPASRDAPQSELTWKPGSSIRRVARPDMDAQANAAPPPTATTSTKRTPIVQSQFMDVPSPEVMRHADRRFRTMSNQQLLERVGAAKAESQRFAAAAAARELKQRGFDDAEIASHIWNSATQRR